MIKILLLIIPVLVNVAFVTLLERKILGYSQLRKGPNKVRFAGVFQPFNDAIKLFSNEILSPYLTNRFKFIVSPFMAILIVLIIFLIVPFKEINISLSVSMLFLYTIIRINVYPVLISGWSSNNKYALIGSLRSVAQTVSYEVRLAIILIFYISISSYTSLYFLNVSNIN